MATNKKTAFIIGAGPAGLTAAFELLAQTEIKPVILEMSGEIGGISKTINYRGNRIDIGGHRFFSKSDRVMRWWQNILPIDEQETLPAGETSDRMLAADRTNNRQKKMIIRERLSRIFFLRRFFDYPVSLNSNTIKNLGITRMIRIGLGYIMARLSPIRDEKNLEDFFINRFGKELYNTFFKDYTEKVWGVPCHQIKPEWGAQRIKGLSITRALLHAVKSFFKKDASLSQKNTETSLIDKFAYPKYGPGQLWEEVAQIIINKGGEIHLHHKVTHINHNQDHVTGITAVNTQNQTTFQSNADYVISTMPIRDLVSGLTNPPPDVLKTAQGLTYRDFMTLGLLLNKLKITNTTKIKTINNLVPDNWIYIQERDVKLGRLQIFNNWSPYMIADQTKVWIGLEYFCTEGDDLWTMDDGDFARLGIRELCKIDIIEEKEVLDWTVIRMPKAYPAYFGTYDNLHLIRDYVSSFKNLFLIGRNGLHRYNNQDHSMLTAMEAVNNIVNNITTKDNIWEINAEQDYHEEKSSDSLD
ncbi:MAG: NAD(P)/FAD-dependent oxidoreductase [Deltaproteobacteria bacterium]|nr:NAD(P)/FAD-dependent oxidoreductase [Deltaproteobacteria bacterium]